MAELIDTHCHLYSKQFDADREAAISRAREAGVGMILLPNIERATTERMWETVRIDPSFFRPMMGLHPCHVNDSVEAELAHVEAELKTGRYIAVGEIGIDLYWDATHIEAQRMAFIAQLRWAKALGLPVAVHCRNAHDEVAACIRQEQDGTLRGVLHCFSGNAIQATELLDLGMHLGIGGVLTYKGSGLLDAIAHAPLEKIILETDAPYLAPVPHRGKRNEPGYVRLVAELLAGARGIPLDELGRVTSANARSLFNL